MNKEAKTSESHDANRAMRMSEILLSLDLDLQEMR